MDLDIKSTIREVSISNRQITTICRALALEAKILFMDEPTTALTHREIDVLLSIVNDLKAKGLSIVFISHKFDEIFKISDTITVFRDGCKIGDPVLLEPIMKVDVDTPDSYMGDVTGSLSSKRGQIQGTESLGGGISRISALVPLSELFGYTSELRSITSGRGSSTMEPSHYAEVPRNVAELVAGKKI